jgi:PII-like signaling protein
MVEKAKLLKVYVGENERFNNKPLYQYLVHWLKEQGISGVTVSRGIEGYGHDKVLRSARILELSSDLPMILEIVDTEEKIDSIIPEVSRIVPKGLVYTVGVEVHKHVLDTLNP